jgi:natural product precursor
MRSKEFKKKLRLNKKTIATLESKQLDALRGGVKTKNGNTCRSCPTYCGDSIEVPCPC